MYKNILLSEDDDDDYLFFKDSLKELEEKVDLTRASDGQQLMAILEESDPKPEVIFLDINMPRKNGFQCLLDIRTSQQYDSIPVIVMSTTQDTDIINMIYKQGANLYICKPADFKELKRQISDVLLNGVPDFSVESYIPDHYLSV
jgi:DNA-binding response OmpR family regulator